MQKPQEKKNANKQTNLEMAEQAYTTKPKTAADKNGTKIDYSLFVDEMDSDEEEKKPKTEKKPKAEKKVEQPKEESKKP